MDKRGGGMDAGKSEGPQRQSSTNAGLHFGELLRLT